MAKELGFQIATAMNDFMAQLTKSGAYGTASPHLKKNEHITNIAHVTITQDFKEADPDRVFHKAVNEIDHMVNAPRGATTHALGA